MIQTFLSEEVSEEIQIKGRTARQGEKGSYTMILSEKLLEKYLINSDDISKNSQKIYDFLNEKRNTFFKTQYSESTKYIENIKEKNKEATCFTASLIKGDINAVKGFLFRENTGIELDAECKTLILMDATGSMHHLLDKTKKTLEIMFKRVYEVLKEKNFSQSAFQIKIAVFRNYNSSENMILEVKTLLIDLLKLMLISEVH